MLVLADVRALSFAFSAYTLTPLIYRRLQIARLTSSLVAKATSINAPYYVYAMTVAPHPVRDASASGSRAPARAVPKREHKSCAQLDLVSPCPFTPSSASLRGFNSNHSASLILSTTARTAYADTATHDTRWSASRRYGDGADVANTRLLLLR